MNKQQKLLTGSLFAAIILTLYGQVIAQSINRPNIVLIIADDLGWKDVGYQGSDFYETPNIDRLAKAGALQISA